MKERGYFFFIFFFRSLTTGRQKIINMLQVKERETKYSLVSMKPKESCLLQKNWRSALEVGMLLRSRVFLLKIFAWAKFFSKKIRQNFSAKKQG